MKVGELIEKLKSFDQHADIKMADYFLGEVDLVDLKKEGDIVFLIPDTSDVKTIEHKKE